MNYFTEFMNIRLCKEFGWSEEQLLKTSVSFRNDCRMYINEVANQEYIRNQEQELTSKRDKIFTDLQKQ